MNPGDTDHQLRLSYYGNCIAEYTGSGTILLTEGRTFPCTFSVGQLANADIIFICEFTLIDEKNRFNFFNTNFALSRFEGTTSDGYNIRGNEGRIRKGKVNGSKCKIAYSLRDLFISSQKTKSIDTIRFGVTNFRFFGTEGELRTDGEAGSRYLPLRIPGVREVSIYPVSDYDEREYRLQVMKGVEQTCEIVIKCPKQNEFTGIRTLTDDLCYILSIARGTKIQWIYYSCHDDEGEVISMLHAARVTKSFVPLYVIDPRASGCFSTKEFVETVFPGYVKKRDVLKLNDGVIDAYLDSKTEHDYLQARGIKAVIVMEMLKSIYYEQSIGSINSLVIPDAEKQRFDELLDGVKKLIKENYPGGANKLIRKDLYANLKCINNTPFNKVIRHICHDIGYQTSDSDINLFIACRNKLIHEGRFYCESASPTERRCLSPLASPREEYFFIIHFLDKFFLKMLGYHGPYINWENGIPKLTELA